MIRYGESAGKVFMEERRRCEEGRKGDCEGKVQRRKAVVVDG